MAPRANRAHVCKRVTAAYALRNLLRAVAVTGSSVATGQCTITTNTDSGTLVLLTKLAAYQHSYVHVSQ